MSHEPWWRPERFAAKRSHLETRGRVTTAIRHFFAERGFVEVDTPALQVSPGLEPHLMAFATELTEPGEGVRPRFLHTSPEFAMKKLLVAGRAASSFSSRTCFRNGERGAHASSRNSPCSNGIAPAPAIAISWPIARRCCARPR